MCALPAFQAMSVLRCIGCGYETDLLAERNFRCPHCDNLYDVIHQYGRQFLSWPQLQDLFDSRARQIIGPQSSKVVRSGVWRFIELIMPGMTAKEIITLGEGNHRIVRAGKRLREWVGIDDLWIIFEGDNPTGSFKDNGGTVMISVAKKAGIKIVVCSSTGDTSAMASAYASAAGMRSVVILPQGLITDVQLAQPLIHGSTVIMLPGNFDDCMAVVKDLTKSGTVYPANSLNPTRIMGHQATVFLVAQAFGWEMPDWIVVPVGNGSNCSSVGKAMRTMIERGFPGKTSRILGCQSEAASPLAQAWKRLVESEHERTIESWMRYYRPLPVGKTTATAARIGDPVSWEKVMTEILESNGSMRIAAEDDLNEAVKVCGLDGHFICPQTGTALAGLRNAVGCGSVNPKERIVVVSTATGLKFTASAVADFPQRLKHAADCRTSTVEAMLATL